MGITNILSGCLAARNDCLQKDLILGLNERHEVSVPLHHNDRDHLPRVAPLIRMLEDIHFIARLNVKNHIL